MGEAELALADASEAAQTAVDAALAAEDYPAAFAALAALRAPIDRFFDEVMVMDKDEQLRDNRLKLLNRFEPFSPASPTSVSLPAKSKPACA